jgi:hypothetical protein
LDLFKQLLFGMRDVYEQGLGDLQTSLNELYQTFAGENEKRIDQELKNIYETLSNTSEEHLQQVTLPGNLLFELYN